MGKINSNLEEELIRSIFLLPTKNNVEGEFHHCWYEMPNGARERMTPEQLNSHALCHSIPKFID